VTKKQLAVMREWFVSFVHTFVRGGDELHPMLAIKLRHSKRVAAEARDLACDLGWSASQINVAEALGLFHDIGRFPQYAEYATFSDAASVDHGERGWSVVKRSVWASSLPRSEREPILNGIRHHNDKVIPDGLSGQSLAFLKLIRDADKLDIFRVVLDAVKKDGFRDLPDMLPGITLERSCSPSVIEEIADQRICSLQNVRSLGDFLLMQMSWIYDLNYMPAFQRISERHIVTEILRQLSGDSRIQNAAARVRAFVAERLDSSGPSQPRREG
jgi:hypothetical protein